MSINSDWNRHAMTELLLTKRHTFMCLCMVVVTDRSTGRVGAPLTCSEVMLVDWEEGK